MSFLDQYGSEHQCRAALAKVRWSTGLCCQMCSHMGHCHLKGSDVYQCNRCKLQVSLTSGMLFAETKLPLRTWLLPIFLLTQHNNGISALALRTWVVGVTAAAQVAAVRARSRVSLRCSARPRATPSLCGWTCCRGFAGGCWPRGRSVTGCPAPRWYPMDSIAVAASLMPIARIRLSLPAAAWLIWATPPSGVNTRLGNVKNALHGTYHALRPKYLQRYLSEFCYRFVHPRFWGNRRFDWAALVPRLIVAAAHTPPMSYRLATLDA